MEFIGNASYNLNNFFEVIKIAASHNRKVYFFDDKKHLSTAWGSRSASYKEPWILAGNEQQTGELGSINFEIPLNIKQSELSNPNFNIEETASFDLINKLKENGVNNLYFQSAVKQGSSFKIQVFQTIQKVGKIQLNLVTEDNISEDLYFSNFEFPNNQFGHVSVGGKMSFPPFIFKDNHIYATSDLSPDIKRKIQEFNKKFVAINERSMYSQIDMISNQVLILFTNLKILYNIFKAKSKKIISESEINACEFAIGNPNDNSTSGISSISYTQFNDLEIIEKLDYNKDIFPIYVFPCISNLKLEHMSGALNRFTYNYYIQTLEDKIDTIGFYEVLDLNTKSKNAKIHNNLIRESAIDLVSANLYFNSGEFVPRENIQEHTLEIVNNSMQELKNKWDRVSTRFLKLFNPTPLEFGLFSLTFIKKYFSIISINQYSVTQLFFNEELNPIKLFFEDAYGNYEDFFGKDAVSTFTKRISAFNLIPYSWVNSRIEKDTFNLKNIKYNNGRQSFYIHSIAKFLPNYKYTDLLNTSRGERRSKSNIIIINDSGNKQMWKKKTREFLKIVSRNFANILILDPIDKIQLKLLERVFGNSKHIIRYSDYEKEIDLKKTPKEKVINQKNITFYTKDSFTGNVSLNTRSGSFEDFGKDIIIVEFSPTKRIFSCLGKSFTTDEFNIKQVDKILRIADNKNLRVVSKNNFKKLKAAGVKTLDDYIENDIKDAFLDFHEHFMVFSNKDLYNDTYHLRKIFIYLFSAPLIEFSGSSSEFTKDISQMLYALHNSMPPAFKISFSKIHYLSTSARVQSRTLTIYALENFLSQIMIQRTDTGVLGLIFDKIDIHPDESNFYLAAKASDKIVRRIHPSEILNTMDIVKNYEILLNYSNKLYYSNTEINIAKNYFKKLNYGKIGYTPNIFNKILKEVT